MNSLKQFIMYSGIAATSALVDWFVYTVFIFLGAYFVSAQVVSRLVGGVYAFVGNKYWSFGKSNHIRITIEGRRFLILYMFSYSLSLGSLWFFGNALEINIFLAKLIADLLCFVVNFVVMRNYVFHDRVGLTAGLRKSIQKLRKTA